MSGKRLLVLLVNATKLYRPEGKLIGKKLILDKVNSAQLTQASSSETKYVED